MSGNEQTEILRGIWNDLKALNQGVNARLDRLSQSVDTRLDSVNDRLVEIRSEIRQTNGRLDNLRDIAGGSYRQLEDRVVSLETRVDTLETTA